ncbi:MAG: hypothetical protein IPM48_14770 [Saprospiraceae bacterium]|nr:hypothetical protein [Saprospiraceae bacterium]
MAINQNSIDYSKLTTQQALRTLKTKEEIAEYFKYRFGEIKAERKTLEWDLEHQWEEKQKVKTEKSEDEKRADEAFEAIKDIFKDI